MKKIKGMKKLMTSWLFMSMLLSGAELYSQTSVHGVTIPETLSAGNDKLMLNGAGMRKKYFMNLYVGALYLKKKSSDAQKILEENESIAIQIHIISGKINSKRMEETVREGFENSTGGNTAPYQEKIDQIISAFKDDIKVGDIYDIIYTSDFGTKIFKNNQLKSQASGKDFRKVMFGIWLGPHPADEDLKKHMLGN